VVFALAFVAPCWPAGAQTKKTTTTTTTEATVAIPIAPGQTAPNGGPLLVPGDTGPASSSGATSSNSDNTGTVVALVISGLLVVALLLALLTYWFWRNTRPARPGEPATAEG
jgi:hypothetical protein